MSTERISQTQLDELRKENASRNLHPFLLIQQVTIDFLFSDKELPVPDIIPWNKNTDLGQTNVYKGEQRLGRYFATQEEFEIAVTKEKNNLYRDFSAQTDSLEFTLNPEKYSVIKVSCDGSLALAGGKDQEGNFSIDVYLSRGSKKEILEREIERGQERINKSKAEIANLQEIVNGYQAQIDALYTPSP